jgi:hypothetical protein
MQTGEQSSNGSRKKREDVVRGEMGVVKKV